MSSFLHLDITVEGSNQVEFDKQKISRATRAYLTTLGLIVTETRIFDGEETHVWKRAREKLQIDE